MNLSLVSKGTSHIGDDTISVHSRLADTSG